MSAVDWRLCPACLVRWDETLQHECPKCHCHSYFTMRATDIGASMYMREQGLTLKDFAKHDGKPRYPKGSMCMACRYALEDCDNLPFSTMPVMGKLSYRVIVKCTHFERLIYPSPGHH